MMTSVVYVLLSVQQFDFSREDLANLSLVQLTFTDLQVSTQIHAPYKCGTILKGNKEAFQQVFQQFFFPNLGPKQ